MSKKAWIIFAVICAGIIAGLVYLSGGNKIDVSDVSLTAIQQPSERNGQIGDHTFGNMNSKVIMIEYGDYQCPGCGTAAPVIKQITEKYKDKMGFIFRNFPLYSAHPNALAAATAAEAAGKQGKFWEMHDALYTNQNAWNQLSSNDRSDYFVQLASSIGADGDKIRENFSNTNIRKKIDFDAALGKKAGVSSTPSIFINGKLYSDQRFKDGKLADASDTSSAFVWSDETAFDTLVIKPLLKENGIATE